MIPSPVRTCVLIVLALAPAACSPLSALEDTPGAVSLPLELEINGSTETEIIVRADPALATVEIDGAELAAVLRDRVVADLLPLVDALPHGYQPLERFQEHGLEIDLDLERLVIVLQIQERQDPTRSGPRPIRLGRQGAPNFNAHAPQADFSGYANFRLRHSRRSEAGRAGRTETTLGVSHVLNLRGFAFEGESVLSCRDGFRTRELRLVKDFPDRLLRFSAGDISNPINELQRGYQLFGASLAKEFGIQPYRAFTPTSSASFELSEPSTVKVRVNGSLARSLRLEPGSYNVDSFKLAAGSNQMELEILTDSGMADQLRVSEFASLSLLDAGVSAFALSAGFPRSSPGDPEAKALSKQAWYQRYLEPQPIFSGYYKRGLNKQLTASLDVQGSTDWSRLGVAAHTASERFGNLNLSLSHHQLEAQPSAFSSRLSWSRSLYGYSVSLSTLHASPGFSQTNPDRSASGRDIRSSHSLNLSKLLNGKISVSAGLLQQRRHDGTRVENLNASLGKRFDKVYASLALRYSRNRQGEDLGAFLSMTWNPARKWRARSRAAVSSQPGGTSLGTQLDFSDRRGDAYLNARLAAEYSDAGHDVSGSFEYETGLYKIGLEHFRYHGDIDDYLVRGEQSSLTLESAVAFADGAVGFANRIRNSFAIVSKHPAWSEVNLGINPTAGGFQKAHTGRFLSPVLPTLLPFREEYATIQTFDSDLFLERNDYYFFPGYRRGTHLQIGDDAIYSLRGTLHYHDGSPVSYKAIQLTDASGQKVNTFTNRVGRFMATGLRPSHYRIRAAGSDQSIAYHVTEGEPLLNAGVLTLMPSPNQKSKRAASKARPTDSIRERKKDDRKSKA